MRRSRSCSGAAATTAPWSSGSPADRAFEAHSSEQLDRLSDVSEQLDRLSDGYGARLTWHPQADLAREVVTALVAAGVELHHCAAKAATGGVFAVEEFGQASAHILTRGAAT
jgi:hypothetical protein